MQVKLDSQLFASRIRAIGKNLYQYEPPENQVILIGIRDYDYGYNDEFNDFIGAIYKDEAILFNRCTCDPGPYWMDEERREKRGWPKGVAHICEGYYPKVYIFDSYKGHPSFIQHGPIQIWRDVNKDWVRTGKDPIQTWHRGFNIHHGSNRERIGSQSAGCQVLSAVKDLDALLLFVAERNPGQSIYDYMLTCLDLLDPETLYQIFKLQQQQKQGAS